MLQFKSNKQKSLTFMFRDVLSKATTLLGRQKDRCLSVRMRVNARRDFAIFDSRNEETTSFLNRKEIAVSFLVLENPSRKSGVNPHPLGLGIAALQDFL